MTEKELHKLRRQDLLQLLLLQSKEVQEQQETIDKLRESEEEYRSGFERLKHKLDEKDEQIERLKHRLDEKDAQIKKLIGRLDEKDAIISELERSGKKTVRRTQTEMPSTSARIKKVNPIWEGSKKWIKKTKEFLP